VYKIKGIVGQEQQSHGPASWTDWWSAVSVYNTGNFVGQGSATSGGLDNPGSMSEAIAAATKDVHPIPPPNP